ncbi:hypothetical protein [Streptomyces sp. SID13031]|uniref:hypothetical protein n=1 Tax=Streptomyces sp. SID13031 TaxID=2706046 RepID=UPI0013CA0D74|nr:hypothetical protein [Streptomyces sp. SID13031]NEA35572.1 hypothetical protein [Streptomyces sp. SID13031]
MLKNALRVTALAASAAIATSTFLPASTTPAQASSTSGSATTQTAAVADKLLPGQKLKPGQYILSQNGRYTLKMENSGVLRLAQRSVQPDLWTSGTYFPGSVAVMGTDGNLAIIYGRTQIGWIGATASPGAYLRLPNTGNLEVVNSKGKAVWNRHMVIGTLTPSFQIHAVDPGGREVILYSSNRVYTLQLRADGNLVLLKSGKTVLWSSGTKGWVESSARVRSDGVFEITNRDGDIVWSIESYRARNVLQLRDDGKLLLINGRTIVRTLH